MTTPRPPLRLAHLDADPYRQFERWYAEAVAAGAQNPEAVVLATATRDGRPSARNVLLKGVDERGFVFFTNYQGRKGRELTENPRAALCFYWSPVDHQVRVEGRVERTSAEESDRYWATRALESRLAAAVSRQSEPLVSRDALEAAYRALEARHPDGDVPRPPHWGGYRVVPEYFEFWQEGQHRLHDRFAYRRRREGWTIERLHP